MSKTGKIIILFITTITFLAACKKWKDATPPLDPRLTKHYCNDPLGVNYNWDFPGIADNSVCFYPDGLFTGTYSFVDSVYFPDNSLDTASITTKTFKIYSLGTNKIALVGFCGGLDTVRLTADKYYAASIDSNFTTIDTTKTLLYPGQKFCNPTDTVTGTLLKFKTDTLKKMLLDFTVVRDSAVGIRYHRGTAIKQ